MRASLSQGGVVKICIIFWIIYKELATHTKKSFAYYHLSESLFCVLQEGYTYVKLHGIAF